jgi:hypothetical protein
MITKCTLIKILNWIKNLLNPTLKKLVEREFK